VSETLSLDDVAGRIRASLDEIERHTPVNEWEKRRLRARVRDHLIAFGVVELFMELAQRFGPERTRAFATYDQVGVRNMPYYELVLEPVNPNAASLHANIDWSNDTVVLYPGEGGRVELWATRKDSAETFVAHVRRYVDAVVSGGFRATYWIKRRANPLTVALQKGEVISAKFRFLLDGKWRRAGELLPGAPGADRVERTYEPY
jgi:hypothetical protein